ncbi:MAG: alanine:cation symporter family protein [Bacteroidota bacterium]|nr:alanine:cation symporter family protein [Bacteroidota bacterium]
MKALVSLFFLSLFSFSAKAEAEVQELSLTFSDRIDNFFKPIVEAMASLLFWDPFAFLGLDLGATIPLVVLWLVVGATYFTIKMNFINFRGIRHAIELVAGKYDNPLDKGEVSHFQALATALSATVGLGNIAGVAVAITLGGPGATFWMIVAGLLGMASKFVECTLGVKYRTIDKNGSVSGGPMYYLSAALKEKNLGGLGKVLAVIFAILCIGGSFGGGNMFQANQAFAQLNTVLPFIDGRGWAFGVILAILVGVVIIGGIKSIARVTEKIVPIMCGFYVAVALLIIIINISQIGNALFIIFDGAFDPDAIKGGVIGVLIVGFQRAAFSNEAGVGSASIAHSAAKTDEPVSEGIVALLEPFIDTVIVCTMTALVIIFTGAYENPEGLEGTQLTSSAFASVFPWFPYLLVIAIFLFAFSTMISWSYYGLKAWTYLFGNTKAAEVTYKLIFLVFIVIGAAANLGAVIDFSDMMILGMAFPNILGLIILSPMVKKELKSYYARLKSGEIKKYK